MPLPNMALLRRRRASVPRKLGQTGTYECRHPPLLDEHPTGAVTRIRRGLRRLGWLRLHPDDMVPQASNARRVLRNGHCREKPGQPGARHLR